MYISVCVFCVCACVFLYVCLYCSPCLYLCVSSPGTQVCAQQGYSAVRCCSQARRDHLKIETKTERMADLHQLKDNEVLMAFASYATIVLTKMMFMSSATAFQRLTNKIFANPEDCAGFGKGENAKKFLRTDEKVERVRRAHLNDIENIVPFLGIGLLYSLSGPDLSTALMHFRIFVGARIYHTIAYLTPLPQPNRALAFFAGYGVTLSMAYRLLKSRLYL